MSARELTRVEVLARVKAGALTVKSAAVLLHVSYRQAKRLGRRYREYGASVRMESCWAFFMPMAGFGYGIVRKGRSFWKRAASRPAISVRTAPGS